MAGGNIKVVVRVRPLNGREIQRNAKCVVQMKDNQTTLVPPPEAEERLRKGSGKGVEGQKSFAFDKSYWSFDRKDPHFADQEHLFNDLGKPLLDNAFQGYNNCIFAYGQTGSGKSYSMMGYGEESGVIPRICQSMFLRIDDDRSKDANLRYTVEVSYLEIYNERVRDLLNPANKGNLKVREHPATGPYVEDLAKLAVQSFEDIEQIMDEGNKARTVAATNMNETSSRSHAVFTLTVTQKRHDLETKMAGEKVAKISLVDLAGSERATSTGATGARLKEGAEINRSLSTLGRVIAALADLSTGKKKNMSMVPYRDSVLTWLLKDSLGGNSMTAMIAAISPADINFEETLSTLRYADSAKRIKNHAVVNEDPNARMIRELKEELTQLRSRLGGDTAGVGGQEHYDPNTPLDKQFISIAQPDGSIKKVSKAEIAEQLSQSEKLYEDLNQTWEEKLVKTELIHKEREAALEELGISIEKGFVGVSTPKRMPHLVNLSDDPLLAECLVYNLKPGFTSVGNSDDSDARTEIRLNGSRIQKAHCSFENVTGQVTLIPGKGAAIMVNGVKINQPTKLRSGNRLILGDFHIFRFNNPQEAREERIGKSLLSQSITASPLGSPSSRPSHSRTQSRHDAQDDADMQHNPLGTLIDDGNQESDWFRARREAVGAVLGSDQKVSHLTDEELDALFEDIQRARAARKGRLDGRLRDEDSASAASFPLRDEHMSDGTLDSFSLDTAFTSTDSPPNEFNDRFESTASEETLGRTLQNELDIRGETKLYTRQAIEDSKNEIEKLRLEKEQTELLLESARREIANRSALVVPSAHVSSPHDDRDTEQRGVPGQASSKCLDEHEQKIARKYVTCWRKMKNDRCTEAIVQNTSLLREAQILGQTIGLLVTFQFTLIPPGQSLGSIYDLILCGVSEDDDVDFETSERPFVAVRVIDQHRHAINFWSVEKLRRWVDQTKQVRRYMHRPQYLQHFRAGDSQGQLGLSKYSLVAECDMPLQAVFAARVQDYDLKLFSPHNLEPVANISLSLEPSTAQAPEDVLKFNVIVHDVTGFAEREGSEVHCQMAIPDSSSNDNSMTSTNTVSDFDEGPIRFDSVHTLGVMKGHSSETSLRISLFARVTRLHLDKLGSWDEMRMSGTSPGNVSLEISPKAPEVMPQETDQRQYDMSIKTQILEMSEHGDYRPVDVEQLDNTDPGTYHLRQGLQRRIKLFLSWSPSVGLAWHDVKALYLGNISLLGLDDRAIEEGDGSKIGLSIIGKPMTQSMDYGVRELVILGQWESSLHGSLLLDRVTPENRKVAMTVTLEMLGTGIRKSVRFPILTKFQVHARNWSAPQSGLRQFWKTSRKVSYIPSIFTITLLSSNSPRTSDTWRHLDTRRPAIDEMEEKLLLRNWRPRALSILDDYASFHRARRKAMDVEATKFYLRRNVRHSLPTSRSPESESAEPAIRNALAIWQEVHSASRRAYGKNTAAAVASLEEAPGLVQPDSKKEKTPHSETPKLTAIVAAQPKATHCTMAAHLLTPTTTASASTIETTNAATKTSILWLRNFAELRPPYLHLYSVPAGEEYAIINLYHARIDIEPAIQRLLDPVETPDGTVVNISPTSSWSSRREKGNNGHVMGRANVRANGTRAGKGKRNIWAVYTRGSSWIFAAKNETEKAEWVLAIDRAFVGSGAATPAVVEGEA